MNIYACNGEYLKLCHVSQAEHTHTCVNSQEMQNENFSRISCFFLTEITYPFPSPTDTRNVFPPHNVIPTVLVHLYLFVILWTGLSLIKILFVRFIFSLFLLTHFIFLVLCSNYVILVFLLLKNTSKSQKLYSMWYFHFIPQIII